MSENKICNYCNKLTADEIVKGDIFCIECGHQRDTANTSAHQKGESGKKKEWWKKWWYIGIWLIAIYFLIPYVKQSANNSSKLRKDDEWKKMSSNIQGKVITNTLKLPEESIQQLADLTERSRALITNNLSGQDEVDFLTISSVGSRLTPEESYKLTTLIEKSKNNMSAEDRKIVERFQQETKKLMK